MENRQKVARIVLVGDACDVDGVPDEVLWVGADDLRLGGRHHDHHVLGVGLRLEAWSLAAHFALKEYDRGWAKKLIQKIPFALHTL